MFFHSVGLGLVATMLAAQIPGETVPAGGGTIGQSGGENDYFTGEPAHSDDTLEYGWYLANGLVDVFNNGAPGDADIANAPAVETCIAIEGQPLSATIGGRSPGPGSSASARVTAAVVVADCGAGAEEYQTRLQFYKFKMNATAKLSEHSSTRVIRVKRRQNADGAWDIVSAEVTNHPNHGRGPSTPGGVRYRSLSTNWTDVTGKGFTTYDAVAGKECQTPYGLTAPNHVCHGDTQFQLESFTRHVAGQAPPNAAGAICNSGITAGGQAP
jgi:hypothetical protein